MRCNAKFSNNGECDCTKMAWKPLPFSPEYIDFIYRALKMPQAAFVTYSLDGIGSRKRIRRDVMVRETTGLPAACPTTSVGPPCVGFPKPLEGRHAGLPVGPLEFRQLLTGIIGNSSGI